VPFAKFCPVALSKERLKTFPITEKFPAIFALLAFSAPVISALYALNDPFAFNL
jgi:hypothetical protein